MLPREVKTIDGKQYIEYTAFQEMRDGKARVEQKRIELLKENEKLKFDIEAWEKLKKVWEEKEKVLKEENKKLKGIEAQLYKENRILMEEDTLQELRDIGEI